MLHIHNKQFVENMWHFPPWFLPDIHGFLLWCRNLLDRDTTSAAARVTLAVLQALLAPLPLLRRDRHTRVGGGCTHNSDRRGGGR